MPPASHPPNAPATTAMILSVFVNRFAVVACAACNDAPRHTGRDCSFRRRCGELRDVAALSGRSKVKATGTTVPRNVSNVGDTREEKTRIAIPRTIGFIVALLAVRRQALRHRLTAECFGAVPRTAFGHP